jgi:hypothetical protein
MRGRVLRAAGVALFLGLCGAFWVLVARAAMAAGGG